MDRLARFIGTGAYTGYAPVASGTFGTLPAVALAPAMASLLAYGPLFYVAALVVSVVVAIWAADRCSVIFQAKDSSLIVVDEIVGYFVSVAFLPADIVTLVAAFFLFRFFDVVKPPPARQAEDLPGGFGVVIDDLFAGLYANLTLRLVFWATGMS